MYDFFKKSVDENDLEWKQFCMDQFVSFLVEEHEKRRLAIITALQTAVQARLFSNVHLIMDTFPDIRITPNDLILQHTNITSEFSNILAEIEYSDLNIPKNMTGPDLLQILLYLKVNQLTLGSFQLNSSEIKEIIAGSFSRITVNNHFKIEHNDFLIEIEPGSFDELKFFGDFHIQNNSNLTLIKPNTFNGLNITGDFTIKSNSALLGIESFAFNQLELSMNLHIEDNFMLKTIASNCFSGTKIKGALVMRNNKIASIPEDAFKDAFIETGLNQDMNTSIRSAKDADIPYDEMNQKIKEATTIFKISSLGDFSANLKKKYGMNVVEKLAMHRAFIIMLCIQRVSNSALLPFLPMEIWRYILLLSTSSYHSISNSIMQPTWVYHSSLWENNISNTNSTYLKELYLRYNKHDDIRSNNFCSIS